MTTWADHQLKTRLEIELVALRIRIRRLQRELVAMRLRELNRVLDEEERRDAERR